MRAIISAFIIEIITGALIGAWSRVCEIFGFGQTCFALVGAVVPVVMTGGVCLENYVRTADALHLRIRREQERGDSRNEAVRTSASAVIAAAGYLMLYAAGLTLIWKKNQLLLLGLGFLISRTLGGMSVAWFPSAKAEGMWKIVLTAGRRKTARIVLTTFLAVMFITAVFVWPIAGSLMALAAMWVWTYFYYMSRKYFDGITEEMEGYFLCLCELAAVLVTGMIGRIL